MHKELQDVRAQADAMRARYDAEKQSIQKVRQLREDLEHLRRQIEQAEREYNLERAAELKHGKLPLVEAGLKVEEERLLGKQGPEKLLREEVTSDEIADIVSHWTGIPVTRLGEGEREKLLKLEAKDA